jgi:hypothetical protein
MASEKGIYWLAVGMMAVLFGNSLAVHQHDLYPRLARRTLAAAEQVFDEATSHIDTAIMASSQPGNRSTYPAFVAARGQTRLASVQAKLACGEARLARLQAHQERMMALAQVRSAMVVCPRQSFESRPPHSVVTLGRDSI